MTSFSDLGEPSFVFLNVLEIQIPTCQRFFGYYFHVTYRYGSINIAFGVITYGFYSIIAVIAGRATLEHLFCCTNYQKDNITWFKIYWILTFTFACKIVNSLKVCSDNYGSCKVPYGSNFINKCNLSNLCFETYIGTSRRVHKFYIIN